MKVDGMRLFDFQLMRDPAVLNGELRAALPTHKCGRPNVQDAVAVIYLLDYLRHEGCALFWPPTFRFQIISHRLGQDIALEVLSLLAFPPSKQPTSDFK